MNPAIQGMLDRYTCEQAGDYENALREIFQELALLGLWRARFFEHAAFYGGTALRVLHGLDRFSEDMDFTLLEPNSSFDFTPYCRFVEKELEAWGFPVQVTVKNKTADSAVESAFLKAETLKQMMVIEAPEAITGRLQKGQRLKIKVEIDTDPPPDFSTTTEFLLRPIPFAVRTCTLPSLFAGKMHALLFRKWGRRVKGRDWYDFIWYISRDVSLDLSHLSARMRQTGHWDGSFPITEKEFRALLLNRIQHLDVSSAISDVEPFLKNRDSIAVWSIDFFMHAARTLRVA